MAIKIFIGAEVMADPNQQGLHPCLKASAKKIYHQTYKNL
jgi:hypothetical protein